MEHAQDHGHIRALDGIRGFALLMVFAYHGLTNTLSTSSRTGLFLQRASMTGWIGVDLFFVLSGFLITTILLDARPASNYFRVFYIRRGLRIFPLYYLVLVAALIADRGHVSSRVQIFFWLNLSNLLSAFHPEAFGSLAHFWSLAIEEQFYFVWPSIVRGVRPRRLAYLCIGIIVGLFFIRNLPAVMSLDARWPELIYRLTPFRVDTLCAGALLAIITKYRPEMPAYRPLLRIVCVCSCIAFLFLGFGRSYATAPVIRFGYSALVLCFVSVIALALFPGGITSRIFSNSLLRKTGKYSYCFYLVHPFVVNAVARDERVQRMTHSRFLHFAPGNAIVLMVFMMEFGVLFGLCSLSWTLFEGPILRLKKHFRYKPAPERILA